jgi:putative cell wall-binding protein
VHFSRYVSKLQSSIVAICGVVVIAVPLAASPAQGRSLTAYVNQDHCINGSVRDEQGGPLEGNLIATQGVQVTLRTVDGMLNRYASLNDDGSFCISTQEPLDTPEGDYYIAVSVYGAPYEDQLFPGYNSDGSIATIHVTPYETTTGADVLLHKFTAVSGQVSYSPWGAGTVSLIDTRTGFAIDTRRVGAGGYFLSTENVARGEYAIRFGGVDIDGSLTGRVYAGGSTTLAGAARFLLASHEQRAGLNIYGARPAGMMMMQFVRTSGGGEPESFDGTFIVTGPGGEKYVWHADAHNMAGSVLFSLIPGHYTYDATATGYATVSGAVDVLANHGNPWTQVDIDPVPGAAVSGTVSAGGTPVVGAGISLVRTSDWAQYWPGWGFEPWPAEILPLGEQGTAQTPPAIENATTLTDDSGNFTVASVPPGTYTVYVDGQSLAVPSVFLGGSTKRSSATTFTVAGAAVDLGAIALPAYGMVTGTVTWDDTATAEPFMVPMAFAYDNGSGTWNLAALDYQYRDASDTQVPYSLALPAGTYRIGMANVGGGIAAAPGLAAEYFQDVLNIDDATTVTVTNGTSRSDVDFALSSLSPVSSTRFAGVDRYATAVEVSKTFSPGVPVVYVASGENFPDALAAAPAAALAGGPLLTVRHNDVPDVVKAELTRLAPQRIVVVGGTAAVNAAVYDELASFAGVGGIERLSGADRFATARAIVGDAWAGKGSSVVYVASGRGFPDALSAAGAAGAVGAPVITIDGLASELDPAVVQLIQDLGASTVVIAGGAAVVREELEYQLFDSPRVATVTRRAGSDRYSTGAAINYYSFDHPTTAFIANGTNFPDALAGAALAGQQGAPLYIVPGSCVPDFVVDDLNRMGVTTVNILGGTEAVSVDIHHVATC